VYADNQMEISKKEMVCRFREMKSF